MQKTEALDLMKRAFCAGRLPHAYCVIGDPQGEAGELAKDAAALLLCEKAGNAAPCGQCDACGRVARGIHPDVLSIGPEQKSRIIGIDAVREKFLPWISEKSFLGGWKIGIVRFADRLGEEAANAILKTLEEPPENTLFMLLCDNPDALLPTISSRCQKLSLYSGRVAPAEPWRSLVGEIMAAHSCATALRYGATSARLHALFERIKEEAEEKTGEELAEQEAADPEAWSPPDSDTRKALVSVKEKERRRAVYQALEDWYRDTMACSALAAAGLKRPARSTLFFPEYRDEIFERAKDIPVRMALRYLDGVRSAEKRIEDRNLPDLHVFLDTFAYLR